MTSQLQQHQAHTTTSRYTEAKLAKIAEEFFRGINKDAVDFVDNYDATIKEPKLLPVTFPNILANPNQGIAVGMATNIPPHNLGEVIDGMCCLIDNPEAELEEICQYIKGPDFPTRASIMGKKFNVPVTIIESPIKEVVIENIED